MKKLRGFGFRGVKLFLTSGAVEYKIPRSLPQKSDDARAVTLELTVRVLVYFIKSYCFGDFTGAHGERPAKVGAR